MAGRKHRQEPRRDHGAAERAELAHGGAPTRGSQQRVRIPMKLVIAASPLLAAITGLLGVTVVGTLQDADRAARSAEIVATWAPINAAIDAVGRERGASEITGSGAGDALATDAAMTELVGALAALDAPAHVMSEVEQARRGLESARAARASGDAAASLEFDRALHDLGQIGDLLPALAADAELGRDLQALAGLQQAKQGIIEVSTVVAGAVRGEAIDASGFGRLVEMSRDAVASFAAAAPADWLAAWERSGVPTTVTERHDRYLAIVVGDPAEVGEQLARTSNDDRESVVEISSLFDAFSAEITADAAARESDARSTSRNTLVAASLAVLLAVAVFWRVTRSITRRIRKVSAHAHDVATTQLPALVEALRDPRGRAALPQPQLVDGAGSDEVGELADAFNAMQTTLVGVAEEQMAVLRRGVSDIFVTLARRNRSLVDRQLALLDQLESDVDDPKVLGDYFKLDHLATRMRRNAESLLVLAHTETRHRRADPLAIDEVVRAAISEVEEYQRVDVLSIAPATLKGGAVADMSHVLAELIDNAAAFSPPSTTVRVTGELLDGAYVITIADRGMGIAAERLAELNDLLATPPVIGLSVEPTLGLSVVSLLAAKHGVAVALTSGSPGVTVSVRVPSSLLEGGERELDPSWEDVPTHTSAASVAAPLALSPGGRLAVELALTAPTPEPRLRRLADATACEGAAPGADHPADGREPTTREQDVAEAASTARTGEVPTVGPAPVPLRRPTLDAGTGAAGHAGPTLLPGGAPGAMLNIGRPLLEGRATKAGLPLRTPGSAKPNVGADDRSVGVSRPDQVRANLAAFARGVTAAAGAAPLDERVAAERAALAARGPAAPITLAARPILPAARVHQHHVPAATATATPAAADAATAMPAAAPTPIAAPADSTH